MAFSRLQARTVSALLLALALAAGGAAADPGAVDMDLYTANLRQTHPAVFKRWRELVPREFERSTWLSRLDGVTTPTRMVAVGGTPMIFGTACKPHDCGYNMVTLLARPDGGRVIARVTLSTGSRQRDGRWTNDIAVMWLGAPTAAEMACLEALAGDDPDRVTSCPG